MDLNDLYNEGDDAEKWTPTLNAEIAGIFTAVKDVTTQYGLIKVMAIKQNVPDAEGHLYRAVFVTKPIGKALAIGARKEGLTKILPGDIIALRRRQLRFQPREWEPTKWRYKYDADVTEGDREAYAEPAADDDDEPFGANAFGGGN